MFHLSSNDLGVRGLHLRHRALRRLPREKPSPGHQLLRQGLLHRVHLNVQLLPRQEFVGEAGPIKIGVNTWVNRQMSHV